MGEVARAIPRIYVSLKDYQIQHQSNVVEFVGNIVEQSVSILIDLGSTRSYITPRAGRFVLLRK